MRGNRVVEAVKTAFIWSVSTGAGILLTALLMCGVAHAQQSPPSKTESGAPAPIAVDPGFLETVADYQMILREIERIEAATGTVEIPISVLQLRQRGDVKLGKIRAWMKEHKVGDDWKFDAAARSFTPPGPVAAGTEAKRP